MKCLGIGASLPVLLLAAACSPGTAPQRDEGLAANRTAPSAAEPVPVAARNKQIVREAFAAWTNGTGNVFDLLTDDVVWTISGTEPGTGVFRGKQDFLTRAVEPLSRKLATPVKPVVRGIYADGDTVIIHFDATATTRARRPYANSYVWLFTMQDGRVTAGTAFLDMRAYNEAVHGRGEGEPA